MAKRSAAALQVGLLGIGLLGIGRLAAFGTPADAASVTVSSGGFSYALPFQWRALDLKTAPKTLCTLASPDGEDAVTFSVQNVSSALPPSLYVQKLLAGLKAASPQTHIFSQGPFVTRSGLHGCRAAFDETAPGGSVHFVVCVFPGHGRHRLLVAALCPASDTAKYEAPINLALKTFTFR